MKIRLSSLPLALALALVACGEDPTGDPPPPPPPPPPGPSITISSHAPQILERGATEHVVINGAANLAAALGTPTVTAGAATISAIVLTPTGLDFSLAFDVAVPSSAAGQLTFEIDANGSAEGAAVSRSIDVGDPPSVSMLSPSPLTIADGASITVTVTLDHPSPRATTVTITNPSTEVAAPASISVAAGSTSGQARLGGVAKTTAPVTLTFGAFGTARPLAVTVVDPELLVTSASPATAERGATVQVAVRGYATSYKGLDQAEFGITVDPAGGLSLGTVTLTLDSETEFHFTMDLDVAEDASTESQSILLDGNGSAPGGEGSILFTVDRGPVPARFSPAQIDIGEGSDTVVSVILDRPATGNETVELSSGDIIEISHPASVVVPSGLSSVDFTLTGRSPVSGAILEATLHAVTIQTVVNVASGAAPVITVTSISGNASEDGVPSSLLIQGNADTPRAFDSGLARIGFDHGFVENVTLLRGTGLSFTMTATITPYPMKAPAAYNMIIDTNGPLSGAQVTRTFTVTQAVEAGPLVITEFASGAGEMIELANPSGDPVALAEWSLVVFAAGQPGDAVPVATELLPVSGAVSIPAGGRVFGVPAGTTRAGAAFTYDTAVGENIPLAGARLELRKDDGTLSDRLDLRDLVTDGASEPGATQFVMRAGVSTQLDSGVAADIGANNNGGNWCTSFLRSDSAGAANGSCRRIVFNELFIDYSGTTDVASAGDSGADYLRTYLELAGPGGGNVGALQIRGRVATSGNAQTALTNTSATSSSGTFFTTPSGRRMPADGIFLVTDALTDAAGGAITTRACPSNDVFTCAKAPNLYRRFDPVNGNSGMQLIDASGATLVLLDAVGWAPSFTVTADTSNSFPMFEGAFVKTGIRNTGAPTNHSLARRFPTRDVGDNTDDFHWDPSPTPGAPNDAVIPTITGVTVNNIPADATSETRTTITGRDLSLNATVAFADDASTAFSDFLPTSVPTPCVFKYHTSVTCRVKGYGTPKRGFLKVSARPYMGLSSPDAVSDDGWTFHKSYSDADSNQAGAADYCAMIDLGGTSPTIPLTAGATSNPLRVNVRETGMTNVATTGPAPGVVAELGTLLVTNTGAPVASEDPRTNANWRFTVAAPTTRVGYAWSGFNDEFEATLSFASAGLHRFAYRVTIDGGRSYTYCDANPQPGFDIANLATLDVQ